MTSVQRDPATGIGSFIAWVGRVNGEVSQWAASMSWWRLALLFLIMLIAGGIISDTLNLKHDRKQVITTHKGGKDVTVEIAGRRAVTITKGKDGNSVTIEGPSSAADIPPVPPVPPVPGVVPKVPGASSDAASSDDSDDDEDEPVRKMIVGERVVTWRGILGDVGSALMVILMAYLAASKIVVKKVAQADAKVRTANDAAEREAMERQLVQARLQVLQAQVEPHFLFNTLSTVDYLIETDPPRASKMQKALITYLRGALPQMRQESSTLGREMRLIRSYLELIQMRIEDRLVVDIAVPEGLETAEFPPMVLQSLVENAIKHGIEPKTEGGTVRVAAGVQNAQLWVEVSDTGVGVPDGEKLEGPTSGTGIGLQNIRERLAMLYPGKTRLMLRSDPAAGTSVKITIPYQVGADVIATERAGQQPKAA